MPHQAPTWTLNHTVLFVSYWKVIYLPEGTQELTISLVVTVGI